MRNDTINCGKKGKLTVDFKFFIKIFIRTKNIGNVDTSVDISKIILSLIFVKLGFFCKKNKRLLKKVQ